MPTLKWYAMTRGTSTVATVLAAFELVEVRINWCRRFGLLNCRLACSVQHSSLEQEPGSPRPVRPRKCRYRLECLFWGVRGGQQSRVERFRVQVECSGEEISSTIISDVLQNANFDKPHSWLELVSSPYINNKFFNCPMKILLFQNLSAF